MVTRVFASDPNPIEGLAKPFALDGSSGGVPIQEQAAIVGDITSQRTIQGLTTIPLGGYPSATVLGSTVLGNDDFIVFTTTPPANADRVSKRYIVSRETFLRLSPAHEAGDLLLFSDPLLGGGSSDTIQAISDDNSSSLLIARTSNNRPLVQNGDTATGTYQTVYPGDGIQVTTETWTGGLLGQRINSVKNFDNLVVHLLKRSVDRPDPPGDTISFNGSYPRDNSRTDKWYAEDEGVPDGNGLIWYAVSPMTYNADTGQFRFSGWLVERENDAYGTGFATGLSASWAPQRNANHTWGRIRKGAGGWLVFPLQTISSALNDRDWITMAYVVVPDDNDDISVDLNFDFNPHDWRLIQFRWVFTNWPNTRLERIQKPHFLPINVSTTDLTQRGRTIAFRGNAHNTTFIFARQPLGSSASSNERRQFEFHLEADDSNTEIGKRLEIHSMSSSAPGILILEVY